MDIKRVNPEQAGATAVGVRTPKSNAGEVAEAHARVIQGKSRDIGRLSDALIQSGNAIGKAAIGIADERRREKMADAQANTEQGSRYERLELAAAERVRKSDEATDTMLVGLDYHRRLNAVQAELVEDDSIETAEEYIAAFREKATDAKRASWEAAKKPESEGGLGVRGIDLYGYNENQGEFGAAYRKVEANALNAGIQNWAANYTAKRTERAVKAAEDLGLTNGDSKVAVETLKKTLAGIPLTTAQKNALLAGTVENIERQLFLQDANAWTTDASEKVVQDYDMMRSNGFSQDDAKKHALAVGMAQLNAAFDNAEYAKTDGEGKAGDRAAMAERARRNAEAVLKKQLESAQGATNEALIQDMKNAALNPDYGRGMYKETESISDALSAESVSGNAEETRKVLGLREGEVFNVSVKDEQSLYASASGDIAILDLSKEQGRAELVAVLEKARVLSPDLFDNLKAQARAQIQSVGDESVPKSELTETASRYLREFGYKFTGSTKDSEEAKELGLIAMTYIKSNPAQARILVKNAVDEYRATKETLKSGEELGARWASGGYSGVVRDKRTFERRAYDMSSFEKKPGIDEKKSEEEAPGWVKFVDKYLKHPTLR